MELSDYYVNDAGYAASFPFRLEPEFRKLVRGLTPSVASRQVWANCHGNPAPDEQIMSDCESPMSESEVQSMLDAFRVDPQLVGELCFWIGNLEIMTLLINQHQGDARALSERLHRDLGA